MARSAARFLQHVRRAGIRRRHLRRLSITLLVALAMAALVSIASARGTFETLQLQASDAFFRTKPVELASRSVLVAIDERSVRALKEYGRIFGWPRTLHAQVIRNLAFDRSGKPLARVIVLDLLFAERAPDDPELVSAIATARNVIQPVAGDENAGRIVTPGAWISYSDILKPLPDLAAASLALGHANQFPDPDGTVRRIPLAIQAQGEVYPALPLVAVCKYLRRPQCLEGPAVNGLLPFAGRQLPVDSIYRLFVNWLGPPAESGRPSAVPQLSYVDVLNGTFDPELVRGKMVFVGTTATGFADDYWVPTARTRKMPGVEIHVQAAETIVGRPQGELSANLFAPASQGTTLATIFGAALLMALAVYAFSPLVVVLLGALLLVAYLVAAQYCFTQGVLLNLITPPLSLLLSSAALLVNRIVFEEREQRALRGLFATYVPPDVVLELARDPDQVRRVGGERREITVVFTDLKGFTSIAERMPPETLASFINQYLTAMTRVVFEHRGTVDKYIGDAVMAFWNAPRDEPDHAAQACAAALKMQAALKELSTALEAQGYPPLQMRVGITTGVAAVGNMGSELRVAYTALGDTVNLAARLEPLNNDYGTSICISEYTLRAAGADRFLTRFLDLVAVKGKQEPVAVYELLAQRPLDGSLDEATRQMLEHYAQGIERYHARDFAAAHAAFREALRARPDDGPSRVYLERTGQLLEDPPPADWNLVYVQKHK